MIYFLIFILSLLFTPSVYAQTYTITCPNDPDNSQTSPLVCTPNSSAPFINHQNTYPGFISPANITTIINQDVDTPCLLQVTSHKQSGDDLLFLGDYPLNLSITQGSNLLYTGPLIFSSQSLGQIAPLSTVDFSWVISLPQQAGNNYQNLSSVFDIDFNFTCGVPLSSPAPASTSTANSTSSSSLGCHDPTPGSPTLISATPVGSNLTLAWTSTSPVTSYLIAYGPTDTDIRYGNPNIGLSTSYTVGGLTPGAQYCFYVRAQNGCMPGPRSNIICTNQGSTIPIVEPIPPAGFEPEVLGQQDIAKDTTKTDISPPISPSVQGVTDVACTNHYLPFLFVVVFIFNLLFFRNNPSASIKLPFFLSLIAYMVDWQISRKSCCLVSSWYCRYFWLANICAIFIPKFTFRPAKK